MGLLRRASALCALAVLFAAPSATAAPPAPFGRACTPQDGVRFCPTTDLSSRVPSWDGTPIDVDVTLPPEGDGPFPTIVLHHGLGQTKTAFEGTGTSDPLYTNVELARRGFAVVQNTARGFGNSCGVPASRTAGCENGFTRLMDMRYEVRDVQQLLGVLVDEGVTRPDAIGATGISYGGGLSTMLAFLRDRIRLPDGRFAPWTSPNGTPLALTAAWPRWQWSNGASIFTRNGRDPWSVAPVGAVAKSYADAIFGVGSSGNVYPAGGPDLSADITTWKAALDTGRVTAQTRSILDLSYRYHGVASLTGKPAALLLQSGWTDALFPVGQSLAPYTRLLRADPNANVALQLGDLGHAPAANHPADVQAFDRQGLAFLEAWLLGKGTKPPPGQTTAYTTTCPSTAPAGGGPYTASRYEKLASRTFRIAARGTLRVTQRGGDAQLAKDLAPIGGKGGCAELEPDASNRAKVSVRSPGFTLIGQPVIRGRALTRGAYAMLAARLWDLDPKTDRQRLVTRGVYRLQAGRRAFTFTLDGNGWRFPKGHRIVFELLGRDAPTYLPSPGRFSAALSGLRFALPVR